MSTTQQKVGILFWVVSLCLQLLVAFAIVFRKQTKEFPLFFLYTLLVSGRDLVLLFLKPNTSRFAWIYFGGEPVTILVGLAVIYEILWHLIRSYDMLRIIGGRVFWASLAMAVLTGLTMLKASQFGGTSVWISVLLLERSARFVQVGVLTAFIFFISRLGLTWKHHASGIIAGFGMAAGLQLAVFELQALHTISNSTFVLLNSAAYSCAVLIWAAYFIPRRMQTEAPKDLPQTDLARWDELLRKYLSR